MLLTFNLYIMAGIGKVLTIRIGERRFRQQVWAALLRAQQSLFPAPAGNAGVVA
jgi:hypothetical protein